MFLNAGIHDCIRNDYWLLMKQVLRDGPAYAFSRPEFLVEKQGSLSADGERGKVWGINVLANYLFVGPSGTGSYSLLTLVGERIGTSTSKIASRPAVSASGSLHELVNCREEAAQFWGYLGLRTSVLESHIFAQQIHRGLGHGSTGSTVGCW